MAEERETSLDALAATLAEKAAALPINGRLLVGLAGPPGAGKSTCAERLNELLNGSGKARSSVFQMDSYHYDDGVLVARGLRSRKGAPATFDVGGFCHMLGRLKANQEAEIAVPVFDRNLEIARAGARLIPREINVLIVEGNYVLLDQKPWSSLAPLFHVTVSIRVSEKVLRQRLNARWQGHGLAANEIVAKVEANDLPNGVLVLARSLKSDFVLRT